MKIRFYLLFLLITLASCKNNAQHQEKKSIPEIEFKDFLNSEFSKEFPIQPIIDKGNDFTTEEKKALVRKLINYEKETSREILIVTIDSLNPYTDIHKYATDLGNYLKIGKAHKDNGLIVLTCIPCRQLSISTGIGTEKILTDEKCEKIIKGIIVPKFKEENYFEGLNEGINAIMEEWH